MKLEKMHTWLIFFYKSIHPIWKSMSQKMISMILSFLIKITKIISVIVCLIFDILWHSILAIWMIEISVIYAPVDANYSTTKGTGLWHSYHSCTVWNTCEQWPGHSNSDKLSLLDNLTCQTSPLFHSSFNHIVGSKVQFMY